jgi:hypothetical protein
MSVDNTTRFTSWSTEGANKDTKRWEPQSQQSLQQNFSDYSNLRVLEELSRELPDVFAEIMKDNPSDPQAAVAALAKLNATKGDQLREKAGLKKPTVKRRGGWDDGGKTNDAVRAILRQR